VDKVDEGYLDINCSVIHFKYANIEITGSLQYATKTYIDLFSELEVEVLAKAEIDCFVEVGRITKSYSYII
jgi:hypothetical protein